MRRAARVMIGTLAVLWALPTTLVGALLLGISVSTGGRVVYVAGVLEAHGGLIGWALTRIPLGRGGVTAMTLGHVVVATSREALALTRFHERVHVAQCERWGPLFIPAYALASLWAGLRGGDPYRDNRFERQAFAAEKGTEDGGRPGGRTA